MGGAESKPRQMPARLLKTLQGRQRISVPNNAQDTTLHSLQKNPQGEETIANEKGKLCCKEETNDKNINNSPAAIPLLAKHPEASETPSKSTSANTEKLPSYIEKNPLKQNALLHQYEGNTEMPSKCPISHFQESNSRCQFLELKEPYIPFESSRNMLPKCPSFHALNACMNDHHDLRILHKNNMNVHSQIDDSKMAVSPSRLRSQGIKPKKHNKTAIISNSLASRPDRRVKGVESQNQMKSLPKSVSFSNFEKSPYLPVKRNASLKLPTKSVTFDLSHSRCIRPNPSRRNLKLPVGVASTGVLQRRNSVSSTDQSQPLKSCLKLPTQDSADTIPKKPVRSHSGPLNKSEAKEWIIYYKKYLDALKLVPGMTGPSFEGTETEGNQNPEKASPAENFVVVEMDENGYSIKKSEGEKPVDVRRLGKNWRALKGGPTNLMDMILKHKSEWDLKATKRNTTKKRDEHSAKRRGKSPRDSHRKNRSGGLHRHGEGSRDHSSRRRERHSGGHKHDKDGHRDRHKHVHRERSRSRGEGRSMTHTESDRHVSRVHKGHGEDLREGYNENHKDVRRKSRGEYYRKIPRDVKRENHRKSRRENCRDDHSAGHLRRSSADNREEHKEKRRDTHAERIKDDPRNNGHKRHKEKERFNLHRKEGGERHLDGKTSDHATYYRDKPNFFHLQKFHQAENIPRNSKKEGGRSESDTSDSIKTSADVKDSRSKYRKKHRNDSVSRKKNRGDN